MNYDGIPRHDNVLVEPVSETHSAAGFALTESNSQRDRIGFIRALGPECQKDLEVGKLYLYDEFASYGASVKLFDPDSGEVKEMLLLKDADIRLRLRKRDDVLPG